MLQTRRSAAEVRPLQLRIAWCDRLGRGHSTGPRWNGSCPTMLAFEFSCSGPAAVHADLFVGRTGDDLSRVQVNQPEAWWPRRGQR